MRTGPKGLEFDPEHPFKELSMVAQTWNPGAGGQRQEGLWGLLGSQSSWISKSQVWWGDLCKKTRWSVSGRGGGWYPRVTCPNISENLHTCVPSLKNKKLIIKTSKLCRLQRCLGGKKAPAAEPSQPSLAWWKAKTDPSKLISTQMLWYLFQCACVCENTRK